MIHAWTGSEYITILPKSEGLGESLKDLFPMNISHFFHDYYDTKMLILPHRETGWNPGLLWKKSEFENVIDAFANYSRHVTVYKMTKDGGAVGGWVPVRVFDAKSTAFGAAACVRARYFR